MSSHYDASNSTRSASVQLAAMGSCCPSSPMQLPSTLEVLPSAESIIHSTFAPVRKLFPTWLSNPVQNVVTAVLTPITTSYRTGHFRSSLKMAAVTRHGNPLPWYTYPAIDFLKDRNYAGKTVLEFGGGQSTLWWAAHAASVVTSEADRAWHDRIKSGMPPNVDLNLVPRENGKQDAFHVSNMLATKPFQHYDVVIIDGLTPADLFDIASKYVAPNGIIICDNAEGYGFYEGFKDRGFSRVDFYGNALACLFLTAHPSSSTRRPSSSTHPYASATLPKNHRPSETDVYSGGLGAK